MTEVWSGLVWSVQFASSWRHPSHCQPFQATHEKAWALVHEKAKSDHTLQAATYSTSFWRLNPNPQKARRSKNWVGPIMMLILEILLSGDRRNQSSWSDRAHDPNGSGRRKLCEEVCFAYKLKQLPQQTYEHKWKVLERKKRRRNYRKDCHFHVICCPLSHLSDCMWASWTRQQIRVPTTAKPARGQHLYDLRIKIFLKKFCLMKATFFNLRFFFRWDEGFHHHLRLSDYAPNILRCCSSKQLLFPFLHLSTAGTKMKDPACLHVPSEPSQRSCLSKFSKVWLLWHLFSSGLTSHLSESRPLRGWDPLQASAAQRDIPTVKKHPANCCLASVAEGSCCNRVRLPADPNKNASLVRCCCGHGFNRMRGSISASCSADLNGPICLGGTQGWPFRCPSRPEEPTRNTSGPGWKLGPLKLGLGQGNPTV